MILRRLRKDENGAAAIEMAFALPILVLLIWMLVQLGLVFRATAGIQHALGEGARAATVWSEDGVDPADIKATVEAAVYGIGPGDFNVPVPTAGTGCDNQCIDVTVEYEQETDLLFFPGPTIEVERTKRVWLATSV
jgi:Flp pilus assembly protein TadG